MPSNMITLSSVRSGGGGCDSYDQIANVFRQQATHAMIMQKKVEKHTGMIQDQAEKTSRLDERQAAQETNL